MINTLPAGSQIVVMVFIFLTGLCTGSFLNVCIYRIPAGKSIISPPSACPECGERIKFSDMIPVVSYILLKGKCRNCKASISLRYPAVELLTAVIWFVTYLRYGLTVETAGLILLFSILIAVFFIDLDHMIIPNGLVLTGLAGGAAVFLYHVFIKPFGLYGSTSWYTPLIGMVSSSGILFLIALIGLIIYKNDGAMGMGDVKIFMPIGLFLGWKLSLLTLVLSVFLGGITSLVLLILKIKDRKSAIPFGPFIVTASLFSALYGNELIRWYLQLCGY
ncbi:MAG TPA: prepilin peptidase [Clostridiaceae bacterium]|nr:prepilin peptidase [Clostridiaceae bacterium]